MRSAKQGNYLKLNDLWIKSLLFDLNYKFIKIGASLLALAKSIYYYAIRRVIMSLSGVLNGVNHKLGKEEIGMGKF